MHIFPNSKQEWLGAVRFPFKAYTVIAPLLFLISVQLPRLRHSGPTDAETFLALSLMPCSAILLLAALVLVFVGPKGYALPCLGFGLAAFITAPLLLPYLAVA
jgi:hypothetical protein